MSSTENSDDARQRAALESLDAAAALVSGAYSHALEATNQRRRAIIEALDSGLTHAAIARRLGVARVRVTQLSGKRNVDD